MKNNLKLPIEFYRRDDVVLIAIFLVLKLTVDFTVAKMADRKSDKKNSPD